MRIPKEQIPVKLEVPGATARQLSDFGTASGAIGAEYFSLGAGTTEAEIDVTLARLQAVFGRRRQSQGP
jgi:hypothetical protein